eukprot:365253-Chlamydomonas_euryale.AAC.32
MSRLLRPPRKCAGPAAAPSLSTPSGSAACSSCACRSCAIAAVSAAPGAFWAPSLCSCIVIIIICCCCCSCCCTSAAAIIDCGSLLPDPAPNTPIELRPQGSPTWPAPSKLLRTAGSGSAAGAPGAAALAEAAPPPRGPRRPLMLKL